MKNLIQLFNVQLNPNNNLVVSLTQIFGLSRVSAKAICQKFGFNQNSILRDVSLSTLNELRKFVLSEYTIQNTLHKTVQSAIQILSSIKSVRGLRHKLNLPVRGQRTRSNHKTQKRLLK